MKLTLAKDLRLPLDAVTQTIAILAKRRAGKSYTMRRLVEQLFKAGQQVVLVDPKGDQWGVRSAADGKAPGLPIVILGGERGDVPLEPSGGEVVAKLVVEERVSVLLDVSLFRKHEVATFMTAFLENLYRLKAKEIYRTPVMLVIDEADAVAPQKPQKGEERMLGAAEDIVRRGGQRGIGCILVTQRSAVLNKNVLTQAQMLVALRTIAPQDLAAMDAWIQVHGTPEQRKTLMESLPSLPVGDAWFWSPGWPTTDGIFQRVHVLPIETFDSGATPKPGEKRIEPKHAADVDLDALKRQMAATIEKAKADDPRELRKQIADLKKEIAGKVSLAPSKEKTKPVLTDADRELLKALGGDLREFVEAIATRADLMLNSIAERAKAEIDKASGEWIAGIDKRRALFLDHFGKTRLQKILDKLEVVSPKFAGRPADHRREALQSSRRSSSDASRTANVPRRSVSASSGDPSDLPAQVWKRYAAGAAVEASWPELQAIVEGRVLRLGTYGDPAAIPFEVWKMLLASAASWLAYTHAWKRCDPRFKTICMASVDTIDEFHAAHLAGWRTFRVRGRRDDLIEIQNITARNKPYSQPLEFVCPASDEAQHVTTCADCRLCRGTSSPARSVAIYPHGKPTTLKAYGIKVDFFRQRSEAQPA